MACHNRIVPARVGASGKIKRYPGVMPRLLPAMLKGYFDRVWAPGIAFDIGADGVFQTDKLNNIRKLGVVTTYGLRGG